MHDSSKRGYTAGLARGQETQREKARDPLSIYRQNKHFMAQCTWKSCLIIIAPGRQVPGKKRRRGAEHIRGAPTGRGKEMTWGSGAQSLPRSRVSIDYM